MLRYAMILLSVFFLLSGTESVSAAQKKNHPDRKAGDRTASETKVPDTKAPEAIISTSLSPANGGLINNSRPTISAEYIDDGIGISSTDTKISIDAQDVSSQAQIAASKITYTPSAPLADGVHKVVLVLSDKAGNTSEVKWSFTIHTQPPQIKISSHKQNEFVNKSPVLITGSINDPRVRIVVNGINAAIENNTFSAKVNLVEGNNTITAVATDSFGNSGSDTVVIVVDTKPPFIEVTAPGSNSLLNTRIVTVSGVTDKNTASVTVSAQTGTAVPAALNAGSFTARDVQLQEGVNTILVKAVSQAGNTSTASIKVTVDSIPPKVAITAPRDATLTNKKIITVTGTVDKPNAMVKVNNTPVQVSKGVFTLSSLSLSEGSNTITVTAVDRAGNQATASAVAVVLDTTPPTPPVLNPIPAVIRTSPVTVTGSTEPGARVDLFVNSTLQGVIRADDKGAFSSKVDLTEGNNALSAVVYDGPGNASAPSAVMNVFLDTRPPKIL